MAIEWNATHTAQPWYWGLYRSPARQWAYDSRDKRDLRLDLLRGFAVFMMIVDHFGGSSWLYLLTGGNAFYTSGAEAFVFLSGLVIGTVYGSLALAEGLRAAQSKAILRAFTLYKLAVILTLLFAAYSIYAGLPWSHDLVITSPLNFILSVLTLHQTMYLTDIPLMYSLLLMATPIGLWLPKGRTSHRRGERSACSRAARAHGRSSAIRPSIWQRGSSCSLRRWR